MMLITDTKRIIVKTTTEFDKSIAIIIDSVDDSILLTSRQLEVMTQGKSRILINDSLHFGLRGLKREKYFLIQDINNLFYGET